MESVFKVECGVPPLFGELQSSSACMVPCRDCALGTRGRCVMMPHQQGLVEMELKCLEAIEHFLVPSSLPVKGDPRGGYCDSKAVSRCGTQPTKWRHN